MGSDAQEDAGQISRTARPRIYFEIGLRCRRLELAFGAIALTAGVLFTRLRGQQLGPLRASVVAMTGALAGQAVLRVLCETPNAALHLLTFHLVGAALAAALGAGAGRLFARST